MRRLRSPLLILACIGLLVSQLSGLHMHVDGGGYTGAFQYTHVHNTAVPMHDQADGRAAGAAHEHPNDLNPDPDPDRDHERDVSVVELSAGAAKVLVYFIWFCLGLLVLSRLPSRIAMPAASPPMKTRRGRWRPPLRAPPSPIVR